MDAGLMDIGAEVTDAGLTVEGTTAGDGEFHVELNYRCGL